MVDALEIGYAIKDRRAELGMTQAQLAEAAGVSKRCLWSLELGQNPGVQLDKLAAVLGALGLGLELLLLEQALEPLELVQALVLVLELPEPQPLHRLPSGRTPFP